jgi:hypothetical protein
MRNTTILSTVAVVAVVVLVAGIAATTVSGVNMAFANKGGDKIKQTKVVVLNKCANVDDKNKRTHIEDVRCAINRDSISGTGFPLRDGITLQPPV